MLKFKKFGVLSLALLMGICILSPQSVSAASAELPQNISSISQELNTTPKATLGMLVKKTWTYQGETIPLSFTERKGNATYHYEGYYEHRGMDGLMQLYIADYSTYDVVKVVYDDGTVIYPKSLLK